MTLPKHWVLQGDAIVDGVSPFNRGLAYGDGLFETMRVHAGGIPLLPRHLNRLDVGLRRLGIPHQERSWHLFLLDCCRELDAGVLKLIVTRGEGGRGFLPPPAGTPVIIISLHPLPHYDIDYAEHGIAIGVSPVRLGKNPLLAGMKHLNRLEQVLIRQALDGAGFIEGVVLDADDLVVEGAFSNICIVSGNVLKTPLLNSAGVAGVMREWVLEQGPSLGLDVSECELRLADVLAADEVFLCNSINGLWPVTAIDKQQKQIGRWTRALQNSLARLY